MAGQEWLAERFEENRSRLRAVAFRMLGSLGEAEDAVQEAWLRLSRSDAGNIENLSAWLTTVVARVCLDVLRSRKSRGEESLGAQLQEPTGKKGAGSDPEQEAMLADSVGLALLVVLDRLAPAERVAFVLHDLFGLSFEEIAAIVERSPAATRQLASRAAAARAGSCQAAERQPFPTARSDRRLSDGFARRRRRRADGGARSRSGRPRGWCRGSRRRCTRSSWRAELG